ncbi:glutamine--fructose-6-phosphate transaminase (isomerizing) [Halosimplex salinum]|uniref:glutamine--fructose-6-phosphate transaminase (isomerizing) n=1 Tax=Halosimplex salinum TaxID=1710538 RepID=UPI000F48686C|nr:glutamine--fructose-6-phosphate transaminase (isomerizing) [Halosimplex salinum]
MCGIIARIGEGGTVEDLVTGLENLEYRGYDSAGVAVQNGDGIAVRKRSGRVDELRRAVRRRRLHGEVGIGHTRWSTHGPPTDENAHPHTDESEAVAVVHNGVIENYDDLRADLRADGVTFSSDTDTEVVPHLIERKLEEGLEPEAAFRAALDALEGNYAIAALVEDDETLYAARDGSPLVLGVAADGYYLASDVPAFVEFTDRVMYLEDGDVVVAQRDELRVTDTAGRPVDRAVETVDWSADEAGRGSYDHFMLKEIHTQPGALANTIEGRIDPERGAVSLEDFPQGAFDDVRRVQLVGCGTSYHAALFGETMLKRAGVRAEAIRANEYGVSAGPADEETLVVAVTQSGETADTLAAVEDAGQRGARTLAVTNVVGSSVTRVADDSLFIRAGPEIGVAATKTYSSQTVTLGLLALRLVDDVPAADPHFDRRELLSALRDLPDQVESVLQTNDAESLARTYSDHDSYFFIGRGQANSVAKEGALKFKEITYEHAEGFAAGELKHGPLALVTPNTPLFAVCSGDEEQDEKTLTNATEAQARGAPVVVVGPDHSDDVADARLPVPDTHPVWATLLANVQLQLVSYHAAVQLDRAIDKPRNLAKSVTVE